MHGSRYIFLFYPSHGGGEKGKGSHRTSEGALYRGVLTYLVERGCAALIFEKWVYFSRKILKNGYPFLPKSPLKMGRGFEARAAHPCPTQI